jgi:hypothetical protein
MMRRTPQHRSGITQREIEMPNKPERPIVGIPEQSYQPSKAELEEPIRVPVATFEEAVKALVRPANVCRIPMGKSRKRK